MGYRRAVQHPEDPHEKHNLIDSKDSNLLETKVAPRDNYSSLSPDLLDKDQKAERMFASFEKTDALVEKMVDEQKKAPDAAH